MRFPDVLPYEKRTEKKHSFQVPAIFTTFYFFDKILLHTQSWKSHFCQKNGQKFIFDEKKPQQLYFDHFIRENSNWILLQFKIWCQFWREISNYLYCNNIHLIKFSDKIVYLISLCVAVDKSDAKDPVWNFCSRRKKNLAKSQRLFSVEIAEVLNPKIGTFQLWVECINIIITA